MRDIRKDLEERLNSIVQERSALQTKIEQLTQAEQGVKALLRQEDERFAQLSPPLFPQKESSNGASGETPVKEFILKTLRQKNRPLGKDELREFAKTALDFGEKAPGRVLHFGLVGLHTSGLIDLRKDGRWELKKGQEVAAD